jgi:hypothetical protein
MAFQKQKTQDKPPKKNINMTPSLRVRDICSLYTMDIGRASRKMSLAAKRKLVTKPAVMRLEHLPPLFAANTRRSQPTAAGLHWKIVRKNDVTHRAQRNAHMP